MFGLIELLRRHRHLVLLLISGLLVPLITDLASTWLQSTLGQTPAQLVQLLALLLGALVALSALALALRDEPQAVSLVSRDAQPPRCRGLIALVGPGRPGDDPLAQAAVRAIEYHLGDEGALRVCWLIASSGEGGSVPVAEQIRRAYQERCRVVVRQIGNAFAVQDTYDAVQRIYNQELYSGEFQELGLTPQQVIGDFTGGTRPMSVGLALACGKDRPMQYMTGYKPGIASTPLLVQFRPTRRRRKGGVGSRE